MTTMTERTTVVTVIIGESGLEYRWNGSATVNIYDEAGQEVDVFTLGHPERPTFADVRESVEEREACIAGDHDAGTEPENIWCVRCGEELLT